MSVIAVLALVVAAGEAQSPVTVALLSAASEGVGSRAVVRAFEVSRPSDGEALRVEHEQKARAVVQLSWTDASRLHAALRVHAVVTDRWIDRKIDFEPTDPIAERGRALGFTVASMLPEADPTLPITTASPLAPRLPPEEGAPLGRQVIGAAVTGSEGIGGAAQGVGGTLVVGRFVGERWSADLAIGARFGHIPALNAREIVTYLGAGTTWWPIPSTSTQSFGFGLGADALILYQLVSHRGVGGDLTWKGAPLPGARARLEGTWRLAGEIEAIVGVGVEAAFGTVTVDVVPAPAGSTHDVIPVLRAAGEIGLRLRF